MLPAPLPGLYPRYPSVHFLSLLSTFLLLKLLASPLGLSSRKLYAPPHFTSTGACHAILHWLPTSQHQPYVIVSIHDLTSVSFPSLLFPCSNVRSRPPSCLLFSGTIPLLLLPCCFLPHTVIYKALPFILFPFIFLLLSSFALSPTSSLTQLSIAPSPHLLPPSSSYPVSTSHSPPLRLYAFNVLLMSHSSLFPAQPFASLDQSFSEGCRPYWAVLMDNCIISSFTNGTVINIEQNWLLYWFSAGMEKVDIILVHSDPNGTFSSSTGLWHLHGPLMVMAQLTDLLGCNTSDLKLMPFLLRLSDHSSRLGSSTFNDVFESNAAGSTVVNVVDMLLDSLRMMAYIVPWKPPVIEYLLFNNHLR